MSSAGQRCERLGSGEIGLPDFQASWEALMMVVALRTWTNEETRGIITIVGDASGVIRGHGGDACKSHRSQ